MRRISRCLTALLLLLVTLPTLAQDESETGALPITADVNYTVRPGDTLDTVGSLWIRWGACLMSAPSASRK
jgi:hypothetical protein